METENTTPMEAKDKNPEAPEETPQAEVCAENTAPETATETPSEAPAEQKEETTPETAEEAPAAESEQPESEPEAQPDFAAENAELKSKIELLTAELDGYKAKDEARKAGFKNEFVDDAVILATHGVKDGVTIAEALQAVANRYPSWKHVADDNGKTGFKVGAEPPKDNTEAEDASLDEAFGLRRKK